MLIISFYFCWYDVLTNIPRERIPERVVHASGAVAKGFFQVTGDVSSYTAADFLQPHKSTYVFYEREFKFLFLLSVLSFSDSPL